MVDRFSGARVEPLARHIAAIRARYPNAKPEWITDVVRIVMMSLDHKPSARQQRLLREIGELERTIVDTKCELAELRGYDIPASQLPAATNELDVIVAHTASATHAILENCEMLDDVAAELPAEQALRLHEATSHIYEACSFQDITGQRIAKIVGTLKTVEAKLAHILSTYGDTPMEAFAVDLHGSHELLNGPQRPATAMVQSEIDQLLASFD
jgi:chemotaxis protein CheZ